MERRRGRLNLTEVRFRSAVKLLRILVRSKAEVERIRPQHSRGGRMSYLNWSVIGGWALPGLAAAPLYATD